jgi:hypothetical protein
MRCAECGKDHEPTNIELSFGLPDDSVLLSWTDPGRLCVDGDLCVIDVARYFLRAVLPLPVLGRDRPYRIGLWVEIERDSYARVQALWRDPNQADEPSFRVHIANDVPTAEGAKGAAACLRLTGPTTRPSVHLSQTGLRLAEEQAQGITAHRASEYTGLMRIDYEDGPDAPDASAT